MAEQLESLKDTIRERGREAVVAQLKSCAQKVLRPITKAAGLPQKVSGRYLGTEELRENLLQHVLASTQVGAGCVMPLVRNVTKFVTLCVTLCGASGSYALWSEIFLHVGINMYLRRRVGVKCSIVSRMALYRDNTKSPFQAASSSSGGLEQLEVLKELAAADGKDRVESALKGLSQDILRQVTVAAKLPLRVSGVLQTVSQLQSAWPFY